MKHKTLKFLYTVNTKYSSTSRTVKSVRQKSLERSGVALWTLFALALYFHIQNDNI
jgi:hypothetical protein